jgi:hypothetical protein
MSKPQKRCAFCGGTPATKGHIWPEWFSRYLPPKASHHIDSVGELVTFSSSAEGPTPLTKIRQGPAGSRKPRNTCLSCNGGWMSRLEQANMNQMGALVLGKPTLLRTIDQWLLSSLLCLITIRLEFTDPQMQAVPVQDRRALMKTGAPPHDTWRIWIANYAGDNPEDHWTRHLGMQLVSSPNEVSRPHKCNAQTTTIVIGKLCAHIASSSVVPVPLGYTGIELANIWPDCHIDLDSGFLPTLTDAEVVHLHESWAASFRAV